jgi:alcohol dehydrogenase
MKALRYRGPGRRAWEEVADPELTDLTDAIVRVDATTICGTDLHILGGDVPEVAEGRVLGHEAVGTVVETGLAVTAVKPGDRVLVSCITSCAHCAYCRAGHYGQCVGGGGWLLGHQIDGTQAEYVRVPFADTSTYKLPDGVDDEAALLLADILPTAYEVGVLNGATRPGDSVVVVGSGPIGLAVLATARLFSPLRLIAIDKAPSRLQAAKNLGADSVHGLDADPVGQVFAETDGLGADVVIEAVGTPEAFELCTALVRPGGHIANIGVHGAPATLHLEKLWISDITITTGLVDTCSTPTLLKLLAAGRFDTAAFVTHRYRIGEMLEAYDAFERPAETGALKVALFRS